MATIIIDTKNKKQEKIFQAFLNSLEIDYYTEVQEDEALYIAMEKGRKSSMLNENQKKNFLKSLKKNK